MLTPCPPTVSGVNEKTELVFDAVTRLKCYEHGGKNFVDSDAYCVQMTASLVLGMPDIDVNYYPVITWGVDKVIAADSSTSPFPVCTWTQITVNLQDHSIMATDMQVPAAEVEVRCSDPQEHRQRVEARVADISGLRLPTWQDVMSREYEPWDRKHIEIDTAGRSVAESVEEILQALPIKPLLSS